MTKKYKVICQTVIVSEIISLSGWSFATFYIDLLSYIIAVALSIKASTVWIGKLPFALIMVDYDTMRDTREVNVQRSTCPEKGV